MFLLVYSRADVGVDVGFIMEHRWKCSRVLPRGGDNFRTPKFASQLFEFKIIGDIP